MRVRWFLAFSEGRSEQSCRFVPGVLVLLYESRTTLGAVLRGNRGSGRKTMKRATEILPCESSESLPGAAFFLLQLRCAVIGGSEWWRKCVEGRVLGPAVQRLIVSLRH